MFQKVDPQTAEAIDHFLLKLKACVKGESSFTLILDDPAGNSFIENPLMTFCEHFNSIHFFSTFCEFMLQI